MADGRAVQTVTHLVITLAAAPELAASSAPCLEKEGARRHGASFASGDRAVAHMIASVEPAIRDTPIGELVVRGGI